MRKKINFGITLFNRGPFLFPEKITVDTLLQIARRADEDEFDSVWTGDNLLALPRLESITLLSAVAALTKRVKVGIACMASFALRNPLQLADSWSTLDQISHGRAILVACLG